MDRSSIGKMSKRKGKRVELEIANWLKTLLPECKIHRTQQFCGSNGTSDIQGVGLVNNWHIESKATTQAKLDQSTLTKWINQVRTDNIENKRIVVFHKANNKELVAILLENIGDAYPIVTPSFIFSEEYDRVFRTKRLRLEDTKGIVLAHYINNLDTIIYVMKATEFVERYWLV